MRRDSFAVITPVRSPRTRLRRWAGRLVALVSLLALAPVGISAMPAAPASAALDTTFAPIDGAGSSFAAPIMESWVHQVSSAPYNLNVVYASSNSGLGRFEFTNETVDYAVSDVGYVGSTDTTPPSFPFNFIPITAGGIAFMYNVPGLTKRLQLSSYTACALLTGGISNWDNSAIAADNPGVTLPNVPVIPVTESDSAGTNYVLEEWCIDEQPTLWANFVSGQEHQNGGVTDGVALSPTAPNSQWPGIHNGLDDQNTTAVASDVANNAGGIGAVQEKYATDIPAYSGSNPATNVALVKNASGDYTAPTPLGVASALAYATQQPDGTHVLNFNGTGQYVYNPSTYSYLLTPTTGWSSTKGATMSSFVNYVLTLGQKLAPEDDYASLGLSLEQYGINAVTKNVPGAVALTSAEQSGYSCGDFTVAEVQAGATTPTCGVTEATAAPPPADAGTLPSSTSSTTAPSGATSSSTGAKTSSSTNSGSVASALGSGSSSSGTSGTTGTGSSGTGTSGTGATTGSTAAGVDPAVSLSGAAAMPNTGGDPWPFALSGTLLLVTGAIGRRGVLRRRARSLR